MIICTVHVTRLTSKSLSPEWPVSFDNATLIFEDKSCRSDHRGLEDGFEPKAGSYVRTIDGVPETGLLRSWMRTCERDHGTTCNALESVPAGVNIRFIDTTTNCIVPGSLTNRYFALSSVGGSAVQFKLLKSNIEKVALPNALSDAPLPQTIEDSMSLVASMGERYLWVDALRIV